MKTSQLILTLALAGTMNIALAGNLSDAELTTFNNGDPLSSADMNANFDAAQADINDNDSRITTNASDLSTHSGSASAHHTRYTDAEAQAANVNLLGAVKQSTGITSTQITSTSSATTQDMNTLTVTPPADGYVWVSASGRLGINQTIAASNHGYVYLTTTSQGSNPGNYVFFRLDGGSAISTWRPLHVSSDIISVTQGAPVTFYLTAYRDSSGSNSVFLGGGNMTAIFFPAAMP